MIKLLFSLFAIIVNAGPNITSLYNVIKYNGIILTDDFGIEIGVKGGSVILGPTTVYSIYYGIVSDSKKALISNFINGISYTSWWDILSMYNEKIWYSDFGGYTGDLSETTRLTEISINYPTSRCTSGRTTPKNCQEGLWHGINLKISAATNIIDYMINSSLVNYKPISPDSGTGPDSSPYNIYLVFLGKNIRYSNDLGKDCDNWCSFHSFNSVGAYVYQVLSTNICKRCEFNNSPNSDPTLDSLINELASGLVSLVTNPAKTGWFTTGLGGVASICSGSYIFPFQTPNGKNATIKVNSNYYYIQDLWQSGVGCSNKYFLPYVPINEQPILNHIKQGVTNVYLIYYGIFRSAQKKLIEDFIKGISSSDWWKIIETYYTQTSATAMKRFIHSNITLYDSIDYGLRFGYNKYGWNIIDINPNVGALDTDSNTPNMVIDSVNAGYFPQDSSGIYTVLLSDNVTSDIVCTLSCSENTLVLEIFSWNFNFIIDGLHTLCPGKCVSINNLISPNAELTGDVYADNIIDNLAGHIASIITNSNGNSWSSGSNEINSLRVRNYISTYILDNGSTANINFNGTDYLIQSLWQNEFGCVNFAHPVVLPFISNSLTQLIRINKAFDDL